MSTILRRWTQFQTSATFNSQLTRCKRFCTKGSDDHDDGKKKDTLSEKEPIKSRHDIAPVNSTDLSDEEFKRRYYNEEHDVWAHDDEHLSTYKYPKFFAERSIFEAGDLIKRDFKNTIMKGRMPADGEVYPHHVDIAIFGGGVIGSSIAYWLKQKAPDSFSLIVIEKDLQYTRASTTLSVGGIRQQFSLEENIYMSMISADFLRHIKRHLSVLDTPPPDLCFQPHGYLFLATENGAEQLVKNHKIQTQCGAFVDLFDAEKLKQKFPWLNTEGIVLGAHGLQNEGWFDPWTLLIALKGKAEFLGAQYLQAEVVDFNLKTIEASQQMRDDTGDLLERCNHVIVRTPEGKEKQITFGYGVVACGAQSADIARMLRLGDKPEGLRSFSCPIEPRKRYVYVFNCPDGPGLDFPLIVDPSGVYCRREGLGGNYIAGSSPPEHEEPDISNLDVDYSYFENAIWPTLAHRVKAFEKLKVQGAWAGYYDYNYFDQNAIIGAHPYYENIFWCTGFSGHGIQMAPAVGRAMMELILERRYITLDLSRFGWDRILNQVKLEEKNIV